MTLRAGTPEAPPRKDSIVRIIFRFMVPLVCLAAFRPLLANDLEDKFIAAGLVDVQQVAPDVKVDLVNSDADKNFFEEDFYGDLNKAYLRQPVADRIARAQKILEARHPGHSLQILDAARPRSVSRAMYEKMRGTRFERYVANPDKGSMHNYGIAVDITILDGDGTELDMGPSPFKASHAKIYWQYFLKKIGIGLSDEQTTNRELLKQVMLQAGFHPLAHEWWHFNGMQKDDARKTYSIIE